MPAIISIVGHSKSGKTTFLEKLIPELKRRGYRVATIKHTQHIDFGNPDKDSERHLKAGSQATAISSHDRLAFIKKLDREATLDEIVPLFGNDYDIILAEGFKQGNAPKIEVHRKESGPLLTNLKKLVAIATNEPLDTKIRQFSLDDIKGIADFLEKEFIKAN
ncbi:MAG: molybdopterin-guanine dinucleotide biosynthesis protein B [Chloroflexota bacterium]